MRRDLVIITIATALILIAAGILGMNPSRESPATFSPDVASVVETRETVPGTTVHAQGTAPDIATEISREQVIGIVNGEYSAFTYSIASIRLADQYAKKPLYVIELVPVKGSTAERNETVFIDATTGDYYSPAQENAKISVERAKKLVREAFPQLAPDRIQMKFSDGLQYERGWAFSLMNGSERIVQGGLEPDTGGLKWYATGIVRKDRPENPLISLDAARDIANREVRNRNGILSVVLSESRLDPLGMPGEKIAGKYVFVYKRMISGVPCDCDGLTIVVDSVAGNVVEYRKMWSLPENAVTSSEPAITRDAAIKTVQDEATKMYPASASGLRIVSAELLWKDLHNADKIVPAPGSIHLGWKVLFDDEIIRAQQWPNPATGWIDAQTGSLLEMYYRH